LAKRANIILWRAEGLALSEIARRLAVGRCTVRKWLKRFLNQRMAGHAHTPGLGRQSVFSPEVAVHLVTMAGGRPDLRGRSLSQWAVSNWPVNCNARASSSLFPHSHG
jgi:transposase